MIVVPEKSIQVQSSMTQSSSAMVSVIENEGVYSLMNIDPHSSNVPGTIFVSKNIEHLKVTDIGEETDRVRILVEKKTTGTNSKDKCSVDVRGYVLENDRWIRNEVMVVPVQDRIYSRVDGIMESAKLKNKRVLIIGQGSGGSPIGVGLVQSGLGNITLVDNDRMCVGNVARHVLGLESIGRLKVLAMADFLRRKNPKLNISTFQEKIGLDNIEFIRSLVREHDLAICATGDPVSKRIMNKVCVQEGKVLIIAGCFRRAYGGNVLRVRPWEAESPCYQCLLQKFPEDFHYEEVSNAEQAEGLAYTDRPVPIEPGLATDILPVSTMVVKLAVQELLQGTETTLRSLDKDLKFAFYLWYNRREKNTPAEKFEPLLDHIDGMHILRWYGVNISREPTCEECGEGGLAKRYNINVTEEDMGFFDEENKE